MDVRYTVQKVPRGDLIEFAELGSQLENKTSAASRLHAEQGGASVSTCRQEKCDCQVRDETAASMHVRASSIERFLEMLLSESLMSNFVIGLPASGKSISVWHESFTCKSIRQVRHVLQQDLLSSAIGRRKLSAYKVIRVEVEGRATRRLNLNDSVDLFLFGRCRRPFLRAVMMTSHDTISRARSEANLAHCVPGKDSVAVSETLVRVIP